MKLDFSNEELAMLGHALQLKIASLKRASNASREPEFKALYDKQVSAYTGLSLRVGGQNATQPSE